MSQALAAPQGWVQPAVLALLWGAAKLCTAWAAATQAEVHPHTALGSSLFPLQTMTWTRLLGCCPSSGGSGCRAGV